MIIKSFYVTGVSNELYGTENDMIYKDIDCVSDDEDNSSSGNRNR